MSHTKSIHLTLKHDILRTIINYKLDNVILILQAFTLYNIKHARINTTLL
jgi:hypothetical protein